MKKSIGSGPIGGGIGSLESNSLPSLEGSTYSTLQDWFDVSQSAGKISGGEITDNGDGTVSVAAGTGYIKTTDNDIGSTKFFDWDADLSLEITNNTTKYIYVSYNAGSPIVATSATIPSDRNTNVLLGMVYREDSTIHIVSAGLYIGGFPKNVFFKDIEVNGKLQRVLGLSISETGTRNIEISSGIVYAGYSRTIVPGFDSSGTDKFTYHYGDDSHGWASVADQTQIDNTQYYDSTAGALATLSNNNRYGVHWVYEEVSGLVHVVYGTGDYTLSEAQLAQPPSSIPTLLMDFCLLIGKIVIQKNAASFESTESAFTQKFTPSLVFAHNDLSALQGGTTDEYYHLTAAEAIAVSNLGKLTNITKPSTATLTADECKGTLISNYGQSAQNVLTLPPAAEGLNFTVVISTAGAGAFYLSPDGSDRIYLDGTDIGPARVGMETPAVGAMIAFTAFQTGASSYAWAAQTIAGTWLDLFEFDVVSTQVIGGKFSTLSGETISVDWGDGSALSTYSGTDQVWSKDYGSAVNKTVKIYSASALTKFSMTQSGANITFDLADLPRGLTDFNCQGSNTVTGDLADLPRGLTYFLCYGSNTITGGLSGLPSVLTHILCTGSNTITGNLSDLPSGFIYFRCAGSNTVTGDLSGLPSELTYFYLTGSNTVSDYPGKTWTTTMTRFVLRGDAALSATEVDQLLIDLDDDLTWSAGDAITITGNCDPPTAAADAAIASLEAEGVTVTVNT